MIYKFVGIFFITGILYSQISFAKNPSGRISVADREIIERLTRLETRLEEGQKALNQRIDGLENSLNKRIDGIENSLNKRIDDLQQTMLWGFGILFAMIIALFGYIVWDRRTTLLPVMERTRKLEESDILVLKALKEYARKEPKFAEALKSFGLL